MKRKKSTIMWIILAGTQNIGDEAIYLGGLKRLQREHGQKINLNCFVANSKKFTERHNVNKAINVFQWYKKGNLLETIKLIKESEKVYYGGGAMLQFDHRLMSLLILAKFFRKPVEVMACGSMPLEKVNRKIRLTISKIALNRVDSISVRDIESKNQLKEIGVNKEIKIEEDLAYLLNPSPKKRIKKDRNKKIKIMMNVKQHQSRSTNREKVIKNIVNLLSILTEKTPCEVEVVLFNKNDLSTVQEISEKVNKEFKIKIYPPDPETFLETMKKYDVILSMRKHPIIFADMLEIPFFAFDNDPAMRWQVKKMKKMSYLISSNTSKNKIKEKINKLLNVNK